LPGAGAALFEELGLHANVSVSGCPSRRGRGGGLRRRGRIAVPQLLGAGLRSERDQAVAGALGSVPPAGQHGPAVATANGADELSARELEVARLVAGGLSNPAIASALFISVATVKTHVSHILTKLGLDSRVQLASWVASRNPGPPAPARHVGNIPLPVSSFIGRGSELEQTAAVLGESRVVTLTGAGGVGKTRLALQTPAQMARRFADGTWLAELAPVRDAAGVDDAVAAVFSVAARAGQGAREALVEFLHAKELLLVLDNCEHLLAAAAALAQVLAQSCPRLAILATSREAWGLTGSSWFLCHRSGCPGPMPTWTRSSTRRRYACSRNARPRSSPASR